MELEFFSRTFDNRFTFALFEFLLAGVVVVILLRRWRRSGGELESRLLSAALLLSFSRGITALLTGARFFYEARFPVWSWSLAAHVAATGAWALFFLAFSAGKPRTSQLFKAGALVTVLSLIILSLGEVWILPNWGENAIPALDLVIVLLLLGTIVRLYRREAATQLLSLSLLVFLVATALHLGAGETVTFPDQTWRLALWNLEETGYAMGLLLLALALGETSANLFDTVFVRVQVVFIILASLLILVVTRTERADFLDSLRARFQGFGSFAVAALQESLLRDGAGIEPASERDDLLTRIVLDFGNNPELAAIHISGRGEGVVFEIDEEGRITTRYSPTTGETPPRFFNQNRYFLIETFPSSKATSKLDRVDLYGSKLELDRHSRRRTALIFVLFTAAVGFATVLIGLVVHHSETRMESRQQELQQASKLAVLGELAGSVAHEVNNPATTIMSRASFLIAQRERGAEAPDEKQDLGVIVEEARRIAHITGALLGFSRRHVLELKPVDICGVIHRSIQVVEPDLAASGIQVSVSGCPALTRIQGDQASLVQVFVNLIHNSIDAMPDGGDLFIRVLSRKERRRRLTIEFQDTGAGMEESVQDKAFLPFFTTKSVGSGTGLGLAVVYGIIREHRGSIRLKSQPGVGSTFLIELPSM